MKQKQTTETITNDLRKMGICEGDTLLIKADMVRVGLIKDDPKNGLLNALLNAVGPEGTLVISAFNDGFKLWKKNEDQVFTKDTKPNTGLLAEIMLQHPKCVRSTHPTNSYAAIGKHAHLICDPHTPTESAYSPIATLAELGSKCIIIGCVDTSPAPTTTHWAQYLLGQSSKNIFAGRVGIYYFDENNKKKLFIRKEIGGHNGGAHKLYSHYVSNKILISGTIGNAYSVVMDTKKCLDIDLNIMAKNPTYILCSNPDCFSCRATWFYNLKDWPMFYIRALLRKLGLITKRKK